MGLLNFFKRKTSKEVQSFDVNELIREQKKYYSSVSNDFGSGYVIENFEFMSDQHQRYEHGSPVMGLQVCPRKIILEKNINGYNGYQLQPSDGYIICMINGDTGEEQMAAKPMRVVKCTKDEVLLKGYVVNAMTSSGFQEIDMSHYGFSVFFHNEKVTKCILHMYDRSVDIEYRYSSWKTDISNSTRERIIESDVHKIISLAIEGIENFQANRKDKEWQCLSQMFNIAQSSTKLILEIPDSFCNQVGTAFYLLLIKDQVYKDEDIARAVTNYTFYLLSKAIEYKSSPVLIKKRISLIADTRTFFYFTVANALEIPDSDPSNMFLNMPLNIKTNQYIYEMAKYDFECVGEHQYEGNMYELYELVFSTYYDTKKGEIHIKRVVKYLNMLFYNC